jgi:hypothetical protein
VPPYAERTNNDNYRFSEFFLSFFSMSLSAQLVKEIA